MLIYLSDGRIVFFNKNREKKFLPTEQKKAADWLYRAFGTVPLGHMHMSSSCDFPHEEGFKRSFDVRKWVQEIHEDLMNRRATIIQAGIPLEKGARTFKALLKSAQAKNGIIYPLKVKFPGGREIIFKNDSEYILFWNGFSVGSNWNKFNDPKTAPKSSKKTRSRLLIVDNQEPSKTMAKLKPEIPPAYAVQVREARQRAGLSQRQFGKLVGCNQPTVANIEAGRHIPSDALLTLMRQILGLDDTRGVNFLVERQKYLETRRNKRISVMVTDSRRWPLEKVRASVASVVAENTKTFEELLALGGDESTLDDILDELCAHTEEFLSSVAQVSGWSREDLSVQAKDLVAHSKAVALTPVNEEPPSEPIWVPVSVSGGCDPPLVDEVWEGPVYTPYRPKEEEIPAPTESGVQQRLRAVVMSTENSVTFDLCYRRKLEKLGVKIERVVDPRRDLHLEAGKYDVAIVLTSRLSHTRFEFVQGIAERAGLRLVFLDSKSSSWPVAFGMMMSLPVQFRQAGVVFPYEHRVCPGSPHVVHGIHGEPAPKLHDCPSDEEFLRDSPRTASS